VLTVPVVSPADDVKGSVATSKTYPGRWNYGSVGVGSFAHLAMEMFMQRAGIELLHVPYTGLAQVATAIMSGDLQAGFMVPAIAMPQVHAGKLRALAVTSDPQRHATRSAHHGVSRFSRV
jgi:tripartite-type tricarboxylate transporter receptor subunit TctC